MASEARLLSMSTGSARQRNAIPFSHHSELRIWRRMARARRVGRGWCGRHTELQQHVVWCCIGVKGAGLRLIAGPCNMTESDAVVGRLSCTASVLDRRAQIGVVAPCVSAGADERVSRVRRWRIRQWRPGQVLSSELSLSPDAKGRDDCAVRDSNGCNTLVVSSQQQLAPFSADVVCEAQHSTVCAFRPQVYLHWNHYVCPESISIRREVGGRGVELCRAALLTTD
jgi:hypothetical protein